MRLHDLLGFAAAAALCQLALGFANAEEASQESCIDDAMIVFDASGSMSGNVKLGIATTLTRIDEVRSALGKVLPAVARHRRVGLITYGPGPYNQCNVELNLRPEPNAAKRIMQEVEALTPAGKTPLTAAVEQAADVLDFCQSPASSLFSPMAKRPAAARPAISARGFMTRLPI